MNFERLMSLRQSAYFGPASAPNPAASKIMLYLKKKKQLHHKESPIQNKSCYVTEMNAKLV
jgi:hypothetical protein